jgi:hypothetical protein
MPIELVCIITSISTMLNHVICFSFLFVLSLFQCACNFIFLSPNVASEWLVVRGFILEGSASNLGPHTGNHEVFHGVLQALHVNYWMLL